MLHVWPYFDPQGTHRQLCASVHEAEWVDQGMSSSFEMGKHQVEEHFMTLKEKMIKDVYSMFEDI